MRTLDRPRVTYTLPLTMAVDLYTRALRENRRMSHVAEQAIREALGLPPLGSKVLDQRLYTKRPLPAFSARGGMVRHRPVIELYLDPSTIAATRERARREHRPASHLVEDAVGAYLARH